MHIRVSKKTHFSGERHKQRTQYDSYKESGNVYLYACVYVRTCEIEWSRVRRLVHSVWRRACFLLENQSESVVRNVRSHASELVVLAIVNSDITLFQFPTNKAISKLISLYYFKNFRFVPTIYSWMNQPIAWTLSTMRIGRGS